METVTIEGMTAAYGRPEGEGPFPGIVVLHEAFGLTDDIRRIVERFVPEGYATVAPNLYTPGLAPICIARTVLDMARGGSGTVDRIGGVRQWLADRPEVDERRIGGVRQWLADRPEVDERRIGGVRQWLADRPEVDERRIGVIGFCMGGGFALAAAVRYDFQVASVNYGRVPGETARLEGVCPVVAGYGEQDRPLRSHAGRLADSLGQLGVAHDVKVYPGVGHSFMNQGVPRWAGRLMRLGYDEDAAEDTWRRLLAFFRERLGRSPASGSD